MGYIYNPQNWKQCKIIGKAIAEEFRKSFPDGVVNYKYYFFRKNRLSLVEILLEYEGLEVVITVKDTEYWALPFVYMDSIETEGESRGKGLSTKVMNSLQSLVKNGVFKHLNIKDLNYTFWTKMEERYDFLRFKNYGGNVEKEYMEG